MSFSPSLQAKSFIRNLIYRNYYQIKDSEIVFAVADITPDGKNVEGGTGWAVAMAKIRELPIFVFQQTIDSWMKFNYKFGI